MVTSHTQLRSLKQVGLAVALTIGLAASNVVPAAAQFSALRAWGAGDSGQLGNGQYYHSNTSPEIVNIGSDIKQFAVSGSHALALKNDGTVMAWGSNNVGQLGYVAPYGSATPQTIPNLNNVKQVAAGVVSLALKNDGFVWAWGSNYYGDLGHGGFDSQVHTTPTIVNSLSSIVEVSSSGHEMALDAYGQVFTWGFNLYGELGTGDTTTYAYPSQVQGISNVRHIAAGIYHSLALKNDGTVWAWGTQRHRAIRRRNHDRQAHARSSQRPAERRGDCRQQLFQRGPQIRWHSLVLGLLLRLHGQRLRHDAENR